ncbi:hypothetical protein [Thalassomonas actiniarum]|uniref:Metallo-beta-lactamase domain-containing protein n=1 Tax=Thalassomonas actiniarum TaxID=485447 RepID=A0AAF0C237_9GAMM|nr:hypothetical protein [Thalassomonas actiniarum]WDD97613.1 hypothetical protein SG35_020180 [Thalassomonas actiniarum]
MSSKVSEKVTALIHKHLPGQTIHAVYITHAHSDGQSFVYFPDNEIIYQGDFLEISFDNSLPTHMADVEKEFIEFLHQEKLPYQRIIGHHKNNNMTPDVVNAYYSAHHPLSAKQD